MPNIKSAIKRVEVTKKKTVANKSKKSAIRTVVKQSKAAVANGTADEALLKKTQKAVDQAAAKGHMSKQAAARAKSRVAKAVNEAK
ncbi:MAG: 30S ribosomal protein S20 [Clostridiales bacterium]|nr:30S ribosomal protein S20 [Clostridiales bacterium]